MARILIGTAGWTDPTLLRKGTFYPKSAKDSASRLRFYASRFPMVEVDSSYYGMPSRRNAELWAERTPPDFTFNIKAFSLLTGHPTRPASLPKDLAEALPDDIKHKRQLYPRDLDPGLVDEVFHRFIDALDPLRRAGKLGVVLLQFPPWFHAGKGTAQAIVNTARKLDGLPVAVELRHSSWLAEDMRDRTVAFLSRHDLPFVCVDMPQGFSSSLPPLPLVTSKRLALVRFHGRNTETWEGPHDSAADRFLYHYDKRELSEWKPRIESMAQQAQAVHVVMNNCYKDFAVRNAADMARLLGVERGEGASASGPEQLSLH